MTHIGSIAVSAGARVHAVASRAGPDKSDRGFGAVLGQLKAPPDVTMSGARARPSRSDGTSDERNHAGGATDPDDANDPPAATTAAQPDLGALAALIGSAMGSPRGANPAASTPGAAASPNQAGQGNPQDSAVSKPDARGGSAPSAAIPLPAGAVLPPAASSLSNATQPPAIHSAVPQGGVRIGPSAGQTPNAPAGTRPSRPSGPPEASRTATDPLAAAAPPDAPAAAQAISPSAATQVVNGLRALGLEAKQTADSGAPAIASSGATPDSASVGSSPGGSLRTLTINLSPDHLGPVAITMRMTAAGLDIKIAVASPEALQLLERDRHVITAAVEAAGLSRNHLALIGLSGGTDHNTPDASGTPPQGAQNRQDASASSASADGGQPRQGQRSESSSSRKIKIDDDSIPLPQLRRSGVDGSLYV